MIQCLGNVWDGCLDYKCKALNQKNTRVYEKNQCERGGEKTDRKTTAKGKTQKIRQRKIKKRLSVCQKQQTFHLAVKGDKLIKRKTQI